MLTRDPQRAQSWMALMALQTEDADGVRPRECDPELVKRALMSVDADAAEYSYRKLMAFYRNLDEGKEQAALQHLENALAQSNRCGKLFQHALFLEAACSSGLLRSSASQARLWRDRAYKIRKPDSTEVVDAVIAMRAGRHDDAERNWRAARARVARKKLDSGLTRFALEKWATLEAECVRLVMDQAALTMSIKE